VTIWIMPKWCPSRLHQRWWCSKRISKMLD
jgi:hypothetical protein